jgi:hypothetical protein
MSKTQEILNQMEESLVKKRVICWAEIQMIVADVIAEKIKSEVSTRIEGLDISSLRELLEASGERQLRSADLQVTMSEDTYVARAGKSGDDALDSIPEKTKKKKKNG